MPSLVTRRPPALSEPNAYRLMRAIIALSVADTWDRAKLEWALASLFFTEEPGTCLCGHRPIIEHCVLLNMDNGNEAVVGNVCVKRFLGLPSDKLFAAINRIMTDTTRALNADTIEYCYDKGWMNDWEKDFYLDTMRKRKLSEKQLAKRQQVNEQILNYIGATGPTFGR